MKLSVTYLRMLQNHLSGRGKRIFPNQVVFYNAVFGATNPALLAEEYLEAIFRISWGERLEEDENLIKQVNYLLRSGLDSNSANIGKHINNVPELPIPRQHKKHYLDEENRSDIVRRLRAMICFSLTFRPVNCRITQKEMEHLLIELKNELSDASQTLHKTDELSVEVLANVIYEVTMAHLTRMEEHYYPMPEDEERSKVDLDEQRQEYLAKVDCFGRFNADRFFAMKRLAETNVIAANEIAGVYYYGCQYYETEEGTGNHGIYRVERDADLAAFYFKKAVSCNPPVIDSCWSLGYMIWNRLFDDIPEEDVEALATKYFRYALDVDYMPANNSMGLIELSKGDAFLAKETLSDKEREEMYEHYRRGLTLCDRAGCAGWPYGHINVANFLADERYTKEILPAIRDSLVLQGPINLRERWQAAADLNNLWAMNQLAMLDIERGSAESALAIWKQAATCHYPTASLNMALYIYSKEGEEPDRYQYHACLEQASADGSARASFELSRLFVNSSPQTAEMYLSRAEKQNYQKFNSELYHQINDMRKELGVKYKPPYLQ